MSTPASSVTTGSSIAGLEKKIGLWLDPAHIVLTLLLVGALLFGIYAFESKRAEIAAAQAQVATRIAQKAQQEATSAAQANALTQAQDAKLEASLEAANDKLSQANAQLQAANAQLTAALASQQKTDAALTPSALAQRWQVLIPQSSVSTTSAGYQINSDGALATVQALEEVPVDRQTIANQTAEISNDQKTIGNDATTLSTEKAAHQSDVTALTAGTVALQDQNKAIQAQFTAYKKKARKNFIKTAFTCVGIGIGIGARYF